MSISANGPDDWRTRRSIPLHYCAHGVRADERHVNERHEHGDNARPIDDAQTCKKRRELSLFVVGVVDKSRPRGYVFYGRERSDDRVGIVPDDDHDVFDARVRKRADDSREERIAAVERQRRFGTSHPARLTRDQHDGGNHLGIV